MKKLMLISFLFLASTLFSAVPGSIPVQGTLTDSAGEVINGPVDIIFELYKSETEEEVLWSETLEGFELQDGYFSVYLGKDDPKLSQVILSNPKLWLEIVVNNESMGRIALGSVPFAIKSVSADKADNIGEISSTELDTFTKSKCDPGQYIRGWYSDMTPMCETDKEGSEGTAYSAGDGISIDENVISVSGDLYTAGKDIKIENGVISVENHNHNSAYYNVENTHSVGSVPKFAGTDHSDKLVDSTISEDGSGNVDMSGNLNVAGNLKVGPFYLDGNDDHWLRLRDGDDGAYKDLAVGHLWVGNNLEVLKEFTAHGNLIANSTSTLKGDVSAEGDINLSTDKKKIKGKMAGNDFWEIYGEGENDAGSMFIETKDNGNEPIIFAQNNAGARHERMRINSAGNVEVRGKVTANTVQANHFSGPEMKSASHPNIATVTAHCSSGKKIVWAQGFANDYHTPCHHGSQRVRCSSMTVLQGCVGQTSCSYTAGAADCSSGGHTCLYITCM